MRNPDYEMAAFGRNGSAAADTQVGRSAFVRFFESEASGSFLLLASALAALAWANSPWSAEYFRLLNVRIGFAWNHTQFALTFRHWINDGVMALFFFVVGLEIKREILAGELSSARKAALPIVAALGGMAVPAAIYVAINRHGAGTQGCGVPTTTDIAFAIGILALLGRSVPAGLKVFLTALAIADDLGAVVVVAAFYSSDLSIGPLFAALILLGALALAVRFRIRQTVVYAPFVIGVWLAVFESGIHATVAGILLAAVVPVRSRIQPDRFLAAARQQVSDLQAVQRARALPIPLSAEHIDQLEELRRATSDVIPAGLAFERLLHPVTSYLVLPSFALFNAGVALNTSVFHAFANPVCLGVLLGLVLGKQAGITVASWLAIRLRLADMPSGITWAQIHGSSILAGIGFTMALFVGDLAFSDEALQASAKLGILASSLVCAASGYAVLRIALRPSGIRNP